MVLLVGQSGDFTFWGWNLRNAPYILLGLWLMFILVGGAVEQSKTAERITKLVAGHDDPDPYVRGLVVGVMTVGIIVGVWILMAKG